MKTFTIRNEFTAYEAALLCVAMQIEPRKAAARGFFVFEFGWTPGLVTDKMDKAEFQYRRDAHVAREFAEKARLMLAAETLAPTA